ncbi:MAG: hypothetical protein IJV41_06555 [Oscillospiraceae bacterium]|nr:hypothetical protein [Oscillospiraceae bacterium]
MSAKELKEQYEHFPAPLRQLLNLRLIGAAAGLFLTLVILLVFAELPLILPSLLLLFWSSADAWRLYRLFTHQEFLVLSGVCTRVDISPIRRRPKAIYTDIEGKPVKIPINMPLGSAAIGDTIKIYISRQSPVYESDGVSTIFRYYAIECTPVANKRQ